MKAQNWWRVSARLFVASCLTGLGSTSTWACATCGCTLAADAATGYSVTPGLQLNFEFTYIDQEDLRTGTHAASPAQVVNAPSNPALGGGEIERQTINRYLTLSLYYRLTASWNFSVVLPYVVRSHTTFGQQAGP